VPILAVAPEEKIGLPRMKKRTTLSAPDTTKLERYGMSNTQPKLSTVEEQNFTSLGNTWAS
jgi:hypothetical protein